MVVKVNIVQNSNAQNFMQEEGKQTNKQTCIVVLIGFLYDLKS